MEMTLDILDDILFEGTDEELEQLPSLITCAASFSFSEEQMAFVVRYDLDRISHYGLDKVPNCVAIYGSEFEFKPSLAVALSA